VFVIHFEIGKRSFEWQKVVGMMLWPMYDVMGGKEFCFEGDKVKVLCGGYAMRDQVPGTGAFLVGSRPRSSRFTSLSHHQIGACSLFVRILSYASLKYDVP
jgi:hypothetical protein